MKKHWDRVYQNNAVDRLGWYESSPESSLKLIEPCKLKQDAAILNVGAGATRLVDELLELGYQNIIANDISSPALTELQLRLGQERSKQVRWIVDDLTNPRELNSLEQIDLWHDRAVLHFFNDQDQQDTYFNLLHRLVKADGWVIIAAFNLDGAPKCSGLPVFRYNTSMLQERLGEEFQLKKTFDYTYTQPSGNSREFVYTLFQRKL